MLRRAPTTITLTQADVEQWEANRHRKIQEAQEKRDAATATDAAKCKERKQKSRKDRIMGGTDN
jgi:FtsZ-binding cell division protein ZapB